MVCRAPINVIKNSGQVVFRLYSENPTAAQKRYFVGSSSTLFNQSQPRYRAVQYSTPLRWIENSMIINYRLRDPANFIVALLVTGHDKPVCTLPISLPHLEQVRI